MGVQGCGFGIGLRLVSVGGLNITVSAFYSLPHPNLRHLTHTLPVQPFRDQSQQPTALRQSVMHEADKLRLDDDDVLVMIILSIRAVGLTTEAAC